MDSKINTLHGQSKISEVYRQYPSSHSFIQGPNPHEFFNSPFSQLPLNFENIPSPPPFFDHLPPKLNKSDLPPPKLCMYSMID